MKETAAPRVAHVAADDRPCREPGQVVDADYRRRGVLRFGAEGREIVGLNGPHFNNRPLYCNPCTEGAVLAGDRPFVRLIAKPFVHGALSVAIARGGRAKWLHDFGEIEARYRCGRMEWHCTDVFLADLSVTFTVVPLAVTAGFAARLTASGLRAGDRLIWAFGGAKADEDPRLNWDPVMRGNPHISRSGDPRRPLLRHGPIAEWCESNVDAFDGLYFRLSAVAGASRLAVGKIDRAGTIHAADADAFANPLDLAASKATTRPILCGTAAFGVGDDEVFWAVEAVDATAAGGVIASANPARAFAEAADRLHDVECVQIETPEARLDASVAAVCHAVDGNCERDPAIFRHGCMAFSIRFIGWRVICGATAFGWHGRVRENTAFYLARQKQTDPLRPRPDPDATKLLCHEGPMSRFYGRGSIERQYFTMYDVQSQFFDQTLRDWRWTADAEMERLLRPALELHLEWMRECFDPDDDGLYESYINTLPTDTVWYNGGGSAEESAYAYTAHRAAADLARRAGDRDGSARHEARAAKIQRAMREILWLKDRGHFGLYVEQGGHRRVHADAWVYSVFLPIDSGLTNPEEALESLYYTEWALERIPLPFGGVLCQPSNWVPWKWSVRDMFGGDLAHLALAYFQTGLGDEGYELLLGATLESAYASVVPGAFSHIGAGTDFADNTHMFARAVVEGLFGYAPDYPNGVVTIRPAFPSAWPSASIHTPDFTLDYRQDSDADRYRLSLTQPAAVVFQLAVRADKILRLTLDGREISGQIEPGFGCTQLTVQAPAGRAAELIIELGSRLPHSAPVAIEASVGEEVHLPCTHGRVGEVRDLHGVLHRPRSDETGVRAHLAHKTGHHLVLVRCVCGELPRWQVFKLHVTDPAATLALAVRTPHVAAKNAAWDCLDLAPHCNGDVRAIFQHRYLSPRPPTCSVRLGTDGYSAWTFPYWNLPPPPIDLSQVPALVDEAGRIMTPQQVPFARFADERNIAFTSLWDNWPACVEISVNRTADTVWLLVCGSTFPMQTRIANAEFRFRYADGETERLELVPPFNFWMLCSWGGVDYSYELDGFCFPPQPPPQVQLGENCRAMVLSWKLRPGVVLASVTLETLSEDVVIGLMGLSLQTA